MQSRIVTLYLVLASSCVTARAVSPAGAPLDSEVHPPQARVAFSHALPALDGSHLQVTAVEVTYPPGGSSLPHSHPCPVVGYVIDGTVHMQVKGGVESTYKAGEGFYEPANGIHLISANASSTEPARLIAYFVCDHATELSVPVRDDHTTEDKKP